MWLGAGLDWSVKLSGRRAWRTPGAGYAHGMADKDAATDVPTQERLDELGERIDKARRQAEEEVPGLEPEDTPHWYESGDVPPEKDDLIPPAG